MRGAKLRRIAPLLLAAALSGAPTSAPAASASSTFVDGASGRSVSLHASLSPERLGRPSTIAVHFAVVAPPGQVPSPVTGMALMLPAGLSVSTSELGLATCRPSQLSSNPIHGCPGNSQIGMGHATAVVAFGTSLVSERVKIALYSGPLQDGDPLVLASASGKHPVIADIVFGGRILSVPKPFGSALDLTLPIVPGLPGGPDVALVSMTTTLGPRGITYTETVRGKLIRFHPRGIVLPTRCPQGGFPFSLQLSFADGTSAASKVRVRCPRRIQLGKGAGQGAGANTRTR